MNKLGSTHAPNAAYQVSRSSIFWLWRRRFFKFFAIYGYGGHLGHVTLTIWINFRSPIPRRLHMKFGFNQPSGFRGDVWSEDHWSCITHLSAEDMLISTVIEEKKFKILNLSDLDQGQWMTLTFGTHKASCTYLVDCIYQLLYNRLQLFLKTSSPKGNDRSPESNVPRSNLISKNSNSSKL